MIDIVIDDRDIRNFVNSLEKLTSKLSGEQLLDRLADMYLYKVEREAKKLTPVDTGYLRRSIHTWRGGYAKGYVSTNTDYALYVHEGLGSSLNKGRRPFMDMGVQLANDWLELEMENIIQKLFQN
jgi:hypothetical protein